MNDVETGAYVRRHYHVPARNGMAVVVDGNPGVIVGFEQAYLLVLLDGDERPARAHPKWRVQYAPAADHVETVR